MEAKEYLEQVKAKDMEIQNLRKDLEEVREAMFSLGGAPDGERVQTSRNNDRIGTLYAKVDANERKIAEKIAELMEFRLKVSEEINALGNWRFMTVLHWRYIRHAAWDEIAEDAFNHPYTTKHILRIHAQALERFQMIHSETLRNFDLHADKTEREF